MNTFIAQKQLFHWSIQLLLSIGLHWFDFAQEGSPNLLPPLLPTFWSWAWEESRYRDDLNIHYEISLNPQIGSSYHIPIYFVPSIPKSSQWVFFIWVVLIKTERERENSVIIVAVVSCQK